MKHLCCAVLIGWVLTATIPSAGVAQDEGCRSLRFRTNFRLNGAQQHIALADASSYADTKRRGASDAIRTLTEAVQAGPEGGADPLTTWFLFGRAYLLLSDLAGADSSFTRATALATSGDGCEAEIRRLRHNAWVPLQQLAVGQIQSQNYDSALVLLRRSNVIYRDDPSSYMNLAAAFLSQRKEDSAAAAFRLAMRAGSDPSRADLRSTAGLNAARLLTRNNQLMAAESVYREYIVMRPRDMAARGALANVLSAQHRAADAAAVYDSILANADSLDAFQLFDTGVSLFNLAVADTARADSAQKVAFFERAARAFDAGVRKNPYFRDGVYNLANSYLAVGDGPKLLEAAKKLVSLDSFNLQAWQLLAGAYRDVGRISARRDSVLRVRRDSLPAAAQYAATARAYRDSTLQALVRRDSLPLQVTISRFDPRDSSASLRGAVQNLRNSEHAPFTLTLEFLSARGEIVATERVDIPTLNATGSPGQAYDFNIQTSGRGIVAYRYKVS